MDKVEGILIKHRFAQENQEQKQKYWKKKYGRQVD